jgi:outer membrane protein assembly factor BamA
MARPTNQDIYNRTPELEAGSEAAVAAVQALYPTGKVVEAEVDETNGTCEVTVGVQEDDAYKIYDVKLDANSAVTSTEERPNVAPGHAHKKDKPLKERKPHAKTT